MKKQLQNPIVWSFSTYFAEGFPYTLIRTISSVFFRDRGMSLEGIGMTSLFGLPWVLKFLWGPYVDAFSTKRKWLLSTQLLLCGLFFLTAFLIPLPHSIQLTAILFFIASFVAATHDIAIDGYYMVSLDKDGQAKFVGYRVMAYRIAMMTGTGVVTTIGTLFNWFSAYFAAALLLTAIYCFHFIYLPSGERPGKPFRFSAHFFIKAQLHKLLPGLIAFGFIYYGWQHGQLDFVRNALPPLPKASFSTWVGFFLLVSLLVLVFYRKRLVRIIQANPDSFYAQSFVAFVDRERIGVVLAFIIFIRTGEFTLSAMYSPFIVDLGIKTHYGWISAGVGLPMSIIGAMIGGWLIGKYGLKKMIWPFLLLQNLTNVVFMLLAFHLDDALRLNTGNPNPVALLPQQLATVAGVHGFDQFSGGLGTAVLMTYLMRICKNKFKASHYAIGTGLMSVSGLYAGALSGFLAAWCGYAWFFGISFLLSVPGMLLVFWLPIDEN